MIEKRLMGPKGQIVIPKTIRNLLGLKKGSKVLFELENGEVKIKPQQSPEEFVEEFYSAVKKKLNKKVSLNELYAIELEERVLK